MVSVQIRWTLFVFPGLNQNNRVAACTVTTTQGVFERWSGIRTDELADYGLLELEANGNAKRPVVWYDEIAADLPLSSASRRERKANA